MDPGREVRNRDFWYGRRRFEDRERIVRVLTI